MRTTVMLVWVGAVLVGAAGCGEDKEAPGVPGGPVTAAAPEGVVSAQPGVKDEALPQVSDQAPEPEPEKKGGTAKVDAGSGDDGEDAGDGDAGGDTKDAGSGKGDTKDAGSGDGDGKGEAKKAEPKSFDQACPAADAGLDAIGLGKIQLTSEVKDKRPVDTIEETYAGEKVWAFLEVKNLTDGERCVAVIFEVGGKKRASLTLDIGHSPRWRTWAHIGINESEAGKDVVITVQDDQGHELSKKTIPIKSGKRSGKKKGAGDSKKKKADS